MPEGLLNLGGIGGLDGARGEIVRAGHHGPYLGEGIERGARLLRQVDRLRAVEQPLDEAVEFLPPEGGSRARVAREGSTGTLTRRKGSLRFWWTVSAFHNPLIRMSMSRLRSSTESSSGNSPPQSPLAMLSGEPDSFGVAILPRNRIPTSW